MRLHSGFIAAIAAACLSVPATAADLTIGLAGSVTSIDPHFYNASPNNSIAMQIFDRLTERTASGQLVPGLAESWEPAGERQWRFKLRPGVTWHDGVAFTADDVVFTFARARNVPNSPGGFGGFLRNIETVEAEGDLTVLLSTHQPTPTLPGEVANIAIVSRHVGDGADTADYNSGKAAVGTGAFRYSSFRQGDQVVLERNPDWWHGEVAWDRATYRMIGNNSSRTTAILARDVDIIDVPAATDIERFKAEDGLIFASTPGLRVIYLAPTVSGDGWKPFVSGPNGETLDVNPLTEPRVRKALSIAINRQGIAERIMGGTATATGQWLPEGTYSWNAEIDVPQADPSAAKALLAEAGYPDGFRLTIHVPNDRYPNAPAVVQAIAQMWSRIGVATRVEALPWTTFSSRKKDVAIKLMGLGNATYDASSMLANVIGTDDPERGLGASNDSGYSNADLDALVARAQSLTDENAREAALKEAVTVALDDTAIIPLYLQSNAWVMRKGISYEPRIDERTLAKDITAAQ
ncbi:ABC transporter substrate-binding protein [Aureimonas altamirensis]|uniref:ABC transporter substrate-binding protein n=1 Tax=Aureimonas altamirensis TaxID=370622 RepID=UPI001E44E0C6|nr:ABC transporter substrate-binding protein [Aureimonas altamirensis]UHD46485.1 ABC transporter substrate-binding protein [Aureimonas altamirensis]